MIKCSSLFMLLMPLFALAQNTISGSLKNAEGEEMVGAHITLEDSYTGTYTDAKGNFEFKNLKEGNYVVLASYLGYETQESVVQLSGSPVIIDLILQKLDHLSDEVTIMATRASDQTPATYTMVDKEDIEKNNLGQDLPYLLEQTPSLVTTSDAGHGVGYTGLRIRGSDPTRVNVMINGIPLNDAESQGVFWVDLPDLASFVEDVQVQRGVGTSSNGAGSFGGSINIQTTQYNPDAYAEISNSFGSFATRKHTVAAGTGLLKDHFVVDARLSKVVSDGYIDRSTSDLKSLHVSGAYVGAKNSLRFNVMSGRERTYQAWGGLPIQYIDTNRTFNPYDYKDEVDDYGQDHYQLIFNQELTNNLALNAALHYTHGEGFFEQYKGVAHNPLYNYGAKESFSDYGLDDIIIGNDTLT